MPSKKKKYNSRFPPARIKKIMQTDDEIGKVAAAVPVLISKCLEMFLTSILTNAGEVTKSKRAKTMSTSHLKECIMNVGMFDFLKDVVASVPDMQNEEEPSTSGVTANQDTGAKKVARKRPSTTVGISKKHAKLTLSEQEVSEDNETIEEESPNINREEQNGIISMKSEPTLPESKPTGENPSFHISLDALMSPGSNAKPRSEQAAESSRPKSENTQLKVSDALADYSSMIERSDSANGVSSPQKPMDLTVNSAEAREYTELKQRATNSAGHDARKLTATAKQEVCGKVEKKTHIQLPGSSQNISTPLSQLPGSSHSIPTPLNMPHLYNPMTTLPPAPPVAPPALSKDLNTKVPQGGMLSLLYSGFPGDNSVPPKPGIREQGKPAGKDPIYPYNPVSEHYKRMTMPTNVAREAGVVSQPATTRMSSLQNKEDDDYDV